MALATQCPHCQTVFRVAHDQLKLRGGIVRCGACNEIFDGNAALVEPAAVPLPAAVPAAPAPLDLELDLDAAPDPEPDPATPAVPAEVAPEHGPGIEPGIEPEPEPEPESDVTSEPDAAPALADSTLEPRPDSDFDLPSEHIVAVALDDGHTFDDNVPVAPPPGKAEGDSVADDSAVRAVDDAAAADLLAAPESALLAAGSGAVTPAADELAEPDEPEFVRQAERRERVGRSTRLVMAWGMPLLALLLLVQLGTTFRNPLAARYPALQPALAALCAPFGCKVELPAQIDALAIEQGELQTLADSTFSFVTVLRNGSRTAQAWPHIELVLNDTADKPVLRRVFAPREYLANPADAAKGFGPRSEQSVKLYFELNRLKASGYHIAIFYP
ncbi:DUF3426 domain-containing protein [Pseudoduganella chitinolytica]|uniref:DUF3426 domain-containing protein n=1 Tax=Pseudoduganella chitinolytica TaxID=34070 RepID=A0ABY8B5J5_9BURK|nr:DUF3426 domain-containing protein [Pseudoduganella chitinolytica]WEF31214.1 DUF3426 domain-containing protein [Pseudoduganella chitinolytica]